MEAEPAIGDFALKAASDPAEHRGGNFDPKHASARPDAVQQEPDPKPAPEADIGDHSARGG